MSKHCVGRKYFGLLFLLLFVMNSSPHFGGPLVFPTSKKALEKEEKFIKKVAAKTFNNGDITSNVGSDPTQISSAPSDKDIDCKNMNEATLACPSTFGPSSTALKITSPKAEMITECAPSRESMPNDRHAKGFSSRSSHAPNKDFEKSQAFENVSMPQNATSKEAFQRPNNGVRTRGQRIFSGFYCGTNGSLVSMYPNAELWSQRYRPIIPDNIESIAKVKRYAEIASIYYGSYAYNDNKILIKGKIFVGYDIFISSLIRIGIEVQGGLGWRGGEIASNGVYAQQNPDAPKDTILFNSSNAQEVDFAYTRQTICQPYALSLLQKFGVTLSNGVLFYTKLGIEYEKVRIIDHIEKRDVGTQQFPKKEDDVIFDSNKPAFLAGIGLETTIRSQVFLRMECLFSKGSSIYLQKDELQNQTNSKNYHRNLEELKISSQSLTVCLGAGWRF